MAQKVSVGDGTGRVITGEVDLTKEVLLALREAEKAWRQSGKISYGMLEEALDRRRIDFGREEIVEALNNLILTGKAHLDLSNPGYQTGERFTISLGTLDAGKTKKAEQDPGFDGF